LLRHRRHERRYARVLAKKAAEICGQVAAGFIRALPPGGR
jgi:hypothetical protein